MATIGGTFLITPTPGATVTVTIDPTHRRNLATWTSGEAETVTVSGTPVDGQELFLVITNDATLGRIITMGTGLAGLGIITNIVSKKTVVQFIAVGGIFYEVSRSVGV